MRLRQAASVASKVQISFCKFQSLWLFMVYSKMFHSVEQKALIHWKPRVSNSMLLVYDRNRSFGRSFGQNRPKQFGRSFGETCRTTEISKKRRFFLISRNFFKIFTKLKWYLAIWFWCQLKSRFDQSNCLTFWYSITKRFLFTYVPNFLGKISHFLVFSGQRFGRTQF